MIACYCCAVCLNKIGIPSFVLWLFGLMADHKSAWACVRVADFSTSTRVRLLSDKLTGHNFPQKTRKRAGNFFLCQNEPDGRQYWQQEEKTGCIRNRGSRAQVSLLLAVPVPFLTMAHWSVRSAERGMMHGQQCYLRTTKLRTHFAHL